MLEALAAYDKALFLFLNGLGTPAWDGFWMMMTNKIGPVSIALYLFLLVVTYRRYKTKGLLIIIVGIALLILTTDQLANFFKYGVQRLRPCHDEGINDTLRLVKSYCGGRYGYFSAHAGNSMAVATFFTMLLHRNLRYIGIFLVVWGFLVGFSRVYIGVHYPLDVITGIAIGSFFGWVYSKLVIFVFVKYPL